MKKLPKIYQGDFSKKINNNKKYCYLENEEILNRKEKISKNEKNKKDTNIVQTIDEIFKGMGYSYTVPVIIKTIDKRYETFLISRTKNKIVTLENEIINIDDIISLEIKKNV